MKSRVTCESFISLDASCEHLLPPGLWGFAAATTASDSETKVRASPENLAFNRSHVVLSLGVRDSGRRPRAAPDTPPEWRRAGDDLSCLAASMTANDTTLSRADAQLVYAINVRRLKLMSPRSIRESFASPHAAAPIV